MDIKTYTASEISEMHEDCLFRLSQAEASVREEQCSVSAMDNVKFVTHADYRALEDESAYFRKEWNKAEGKIASLEEELASIKARVGEGK